MWLHRVLVRRKRDHCEQPFRVETEFLDQFTSPMAALTLNSIQKIVHRAARQRKLSVCETKISIDRLGCARLNTNDLGLPAVENPRGFNVRMLKLESKDRRHREPQEPLTLVIKHPFGRVRCQISR